MTTMNESIMKTDRLGRLLYAPEQKTVVIEAYLASWMSALRFAALHGVKSKPLPHGFKSGSVLVAIFDVIVALDFSW